MPEPTRRVFANLLQLEPTQWRRDLLVTILRACLVLGAIVCVPSVWVAIEADMPGVAVGDVAALAFVFWLDRSSRLGFKFRALGLVALLYLLGVMLLVAVGPVAQIYLLGFSTIATFLLGHRFGLASALLGMATITALGLAGMAAPGFIVAPLLGAPGEWGGWFVVMLNFGLINLALVATISSVLATLEAQVARETRARDSLERSEALLSMAMRVGKLGAWRLRLPERTFRWAAVRRGKETFDGTRIVRLEDALAECEAGDSARLREAFDRCLQEGVPFELEVQVDGDRGRWLRWMGEAQRGDGGVVVGAQGALHDITERKQAELSLRTSQRRLAEQASLLEKAQDAIMVRDLGGRVTYVNPRAEALYGPGGVGAAVLSEVPTGLDDERARALEQTLREGAWSGELGWVGEGGRALVIESRWTLLRDDAGEPTGIMSIDTDVTERTRLELQLLRAQRLESIGTLAGGIAHDLNNVIAPILMAADLLRSGESDPERLADLEVIERSAQRASEMVKRIVGFARGYEGRRLEVDPRAVFGELERFLRETFPKSLEIRVSCPHGLSRLFGDPTQLTQVLVNLCVNARDAMEGGGTLTVTAEERRLDDAAAAHMATAIPAARAGRFVVFGVSDDGAGMASAVVDRLFEPFFTTKALGRGTGLGLFTSLAIVRGHGGFITVASEPGRGSRFEVYLPIVSASEAGLDESGRAHATTLEGRGERVLVVDDEPHVAAMAKKILGENGYAVQVAHGAEEAIEHLRRAPGAIDLVLTDVSMPRMDGVELAAAVRTIAPGLIVVGSSGLERPKTREGAEPFDAFLPKPYGAEGLLVAVRGALDGARPARGARPGAWRERRGRRSPWGPCL